MSSFRSELSGSTFLDGENWPIYSPGASEVIVVMTIDTMSIDLERKKLVEHWLDLFDESFIITQKRISFYFYLIGIKMFRKQALITNNGNENTKNQVYHGKELF